MRRVFAGLSPNEHDLAVPMAWATNPRWKVSRYIPRIKPGHSCDDVPGVRAGYNLVRLCWDRPSPTVPRTCNGSLYAGLLHPVEDRYCTIREIQRLSTFPDAYTLAGNFAEQWAALGNSVPPRFMEHVARHVAMALLDRPVTPAAHQPLDFIDKPINPPGPYLFTVISLFAGCGGSSLGYKWAGGKVLAAVEWDANAAETYRLNHHGTPVLERDIKTVMPEELLALTGLQIGELDILDGSPPCQGFSTAGKRNFYDDRNDLFAEYVRLLRGLQPRVFVMENVSGLVKGHMKHIFARMMRELKASGYQVKAQLMNAMYFGVPQSRERVIIIGVREDVPAVPEHPLAQTQPLSFREAVTGLPVDVQQPELAHVWVDEVTRKTKWIGPAARLHPGEKLVPGVASSIRARMNRPAPTLQKNALPGQPPYVRNSTIHPLRPRALSIREMARCHSFPDGFGFVQALNHGMQQIGNSVPPCFMESVARHIYEQILVPAQSMI